MNTDVNNRYIWLGGEIVHLPDAKINVLSPTSQFGLNVFEGIPGYWNEDEKQLYVFRLEDHYKRLMKSAKLLQIDCPYTVDELKNALISGKSKRLQRKYFRASDAFRRRIRFLGIL